MNNSLPPLKDSGTRQTFETGAVRDTQTGKGRYDLISPIMLARLARIMELGAVKYSCRNWEQGMPVGRFIDSALRHINQFLAGQRDEDHLAQGIFNLMGALHTLEMIDRNLLPSNLNDLPDYQAPVPPGNYHLSHPFTVARGLPPLSPVPTPIEFPYAEVKMCQPGGTLCD